jgi:hypothetical protein
LREAVIKSVHLSHAYKEWVSGSHRRKSVDFTYPLPLKFMGKYGGVYFIKAFIDSLSKNN